MRVLEEKAFYPVGGRTLIKSNFRFLSASSENLKNLLAQKKFRADLYYRLTSYVIEIPPLRERPEEIIPLAEYFLALNCQKIGKSLKGISGSAQELLLSYNWPGNVRELQNVIMQALMFCRGDVLEKEDLPEFGNIQKTFTNFSASKAEKPVSPPKAEKTFIIEALKRNLWSISAAAKDLGVKRDLLRYRVNKFGIQHPYGGWRRHERIINKENLLKALEEGGSKKNAAFLLGTSILHIEVLIKQFNIEFKEEEIESEEMKIDVFNLRKNIERTEKEMVKRALFFAQGNKAQAARLLGIYRAELYKKMKKYGFPDNFGKPE